jgi:hypothetical protein
MEERIDQSPVEAYSMWGLPSEPVRGRLLSTLRDVHGGPILEPHLTVVGAGRLRRSAAIETLRAGAAGVLPYTARVVSGFYHRGCLQLEPTPEVLVPNISVTSHACLHQITLSLNFCQVMPASDHCCSYFGYQRLLYLRGCESARVFASRVRS